MPLARPCLDCGTLATATRCPACAKLATARREAQRNPARRELYGPAYRKAAKLVRETAERCWLCGDGPRPGDPWQADHVYPGDPDSPLAPAHRSCNASRRRNPNREENTTSQAPAVI